MKATDFELERMRHLATQAQLLDTMAEAVEVRRMLLANLRAAADGAMLTRLGLPLTTRFEVNAATGDVTVIPDAPKPVAARGAVEGAGGGTGLISEAALRDPPPEFRWDREAERIVEVPSMRAAG